MDKLVDSPRGGAWEEGKNFLRVGERKGWRQIMESGERMGCCGSE